MLQAGSESQEEKVVKYWASSVEVQAQKTFYILKMFVKAKAF